MPKPCKSDGLARAGEDAAVGRNDLVAEGQVEIGPSERFFVFLDGEYLGLALIGRFGLPEERGHTDLRRVHVAVELLGQVNSPRSAPGPG